MSYWCCPECGEYEYVSSSVAEILHEHPIAQRGQPSVLRRIHLHSVDEDIVPLDYKRATYTDEALASIKRLEFQADHDYLILFNRKVLSIDVISSMPPLRAGINVFFCPCEWRVDEHDFVTEAVVLESIPYIEEWLEQIKKEKVKR